MTGENFVLVELDSRAGAQDTKIVRVIRVYDSSQRADEDLALLDAAIPSGIFEVRPVEYVDR